MSSPYYITTAIPYVNAAPHIGFALELVQADVLARHQRSRGRDVRFLSGTDDNSLKNVRAAAERGVPVEELVAANGEAFARLRQALSLSYDDFIRTSSDPRHRPGVDRLWAACAAAGDLYKAPYTGLYCVGCESYLRPTDRVDGRCPEHRRAPETVSEENYFFRLGRYRDALLERIESGALEIEPEHVRDEVLQLIAGGLEDFSVSRSRERAGGWGLPVPGDPDHVIYVWFDALANYITALGYGGDETALRRYWGDGAERVHVIGKGITRFHAVYWPAILLSAGLPLPSKLLVHGYLTIDGEKIGKSLGNAVSPVDLVDRFGVDALRHYLVHHVRSTRDGDFTAERLIRAHDGELADKLGNLVSRTTALVRRHLDGVVPAPGATSDGDRSLIDAAARLGPAVDEALGSFRIHEASAAIWALVDRANGYVVDNEPWRLTSEPDRLGQVLGDVLECLRAIEAQLRPFLPDACERLRRQLAPPGARLGPAAALCPRLAA